MHLKRSCFFAHPVRSVRTAQGFELDQHTVHLGRTEPEGLVIQVTDKSVRIIEPDGLFLVGRWSLSPDLPGVKVQFGASTRSHAVVAWEGTMITLAIEATGATKGVQCAQKSTVREVRRAEFGDPASALAMSTVGGSNEGRGNRRRCVSFHLSKSPTAKPFCFSSLLNFRRTSNLLHITSTALNYI